MIEWPRNLSWLGMGMNIAFAADTLVGTGLNVWFFAYCGCGALCGIYLLQYRAYAREAANR